MGRRGNRRSSGPSDPTDWSSERTMAEAEEADALSSEEGEGSTEACPCGSTEFVLEAFLHVQNGWMRPEPLDIESLTCPHCGREFEAIQGEGGTILRGDFLGYVDTEE